MAIQPTFPPFAPRRNPGQCAGLNVGFRPGAAFGNEWMGLAEQVGVRRILASAGQPTALPIHGGEVAGATILSSIRPPSPSDEHWQSMSILHRLRLRTKLTRTTVGIAQSLQNRVITQQPTREQALAMFREDIHAMRFDGGDGYASDQVEASNGGYTILAHESEASRECPSGNISNHWNHM